MTAAATPKILTPLTLGAMELSHRAVMLGRDGLSLQGLGRLATPGGLLIPAAAALGADWAGAAAVLHRAGARLVAAMPAGDGIALAEAAMEGGCDGIELDAVGLAPARLLQGLGAAMARWGAARLGVRLHHGGSEAGLDATVELMDALNELELGFVHLSRPPGTRLARQQLRAAFRWPLIASGDFGAAEAAELVESRWADAIAFTVPDGSALLRSLRAGAAGQRDR